MDPEKQASSDLKLLDGFPKIAAWSSIASTNNISTDIYKTFHKSSTRNLLYLQSRVAALENLQAIFDEEDYDCRIKDLNSSNEDLEEDDIVESYFRPSVKVIDDLKSRLHVLELVEGRVKAWELLHSEATGQSASLTALDSPGDIGRTHSDSVARPVSIKLPLMQQEAHLKTLNEPLNKSIHELSREKGSSSHRTQHDHINQSTQEGNSRSHMISQLANTGMKAKSNIKQSMHRFGKSEESNKDPIEELTTLVSDKQSRPRYGLSTFNDDYITIQASLKSLENSLNNPSSILPPLPQNLFWGPVSDRNASLVSKIPEDFILHKKCIHQPSRSSNPCTTYHESYQQAEKDSNKKIEEISDEPNKIQLIQQRLRVLEDYYRDLEMKELRGTGLLENLVLEKTQPSLAITLAARSWEDFEIFGSAEKMWERRRCWDELERGGNKPWPFDMSDEWIGKMRKRFRVARDLQMAIKEYHEALVMQAQISLFQQPAPHTVRSVAHRHNRDLGRGIPQFNNSSRGAHDEPRDLIRIDSSSNQEPYLIRSLSNSFSTGIFHRFFLTKKLSNSTNERYISEPRIATTVTIIVLMYLIGLLVTGTWMVKLLGDRIAGGVTSEEFGTITNQQLGVLTAFTVAFSIFALLLGASRWEAFATTAAYAAVMVIFMAPVPPNVMPASL